MSSGVGPRQRIAHAVATEGVQQTQKNADPDNLQASWLSLQTLGTGVRRASILAAGAVLVTGMALTAVVPFTAANEPKLFGFIQPNGMVQTFEAQQQQMAGVGAVLGAGAITLASYASG